jgi:3-phosphoshikimate 1-carboxyvinyltransferase
MYSIPHLDIPPLDHVSGRVQLPGSKSISNRVLLLCALSSGTTVVHDLLDSDDTGVMLKALEQLGCGVEKKSSSLHITGIGERKLNPNEEHEIFLGNAGTAMRPLCAALALSGVQARLTGIARMYERPIKDLVDALLQIGADIEYLETPGFPPLNIKPSDIRIAAPIKVRGDVSSQFLTALLLALPLVSEHQAIEIEVEGVLISKPYVQITLNLLEAFGVKVINHEWTRFTIAKSSNYLAPKEIYVEADASSASYFIAAGALSNGVAPLRIEGLGMNSIQGDIRFVEAAQAMGVKIQAGPNWLEIHPSIKSLKGIELDCNHIPDAAMTLCILALFAQGPSTLTNIASWRVKETDRIQAMLNECSKLGAQVESGEDWIRVHPIAASKWKSASIHTYDDHRMAMCFALAAFNPDRIPIRIEDPRCVGKTFPHFFETLFSIAHSASKNIPVICIDGPSASGKGTLANQVALALGFGYLDSGALYRLTGLAATKAKVPLELQFETQIAQLITQSKIEFSGEHIWLNGEEVSEEIRTEQMGMNASQISSFKAVRHALLEVQRHARQIPGLVADGRDMGSVIFPDAALKIFLTADALTRAKRRHKQLISKGISANIDVLHQELLARDERDMSRQEAPLKPSEDALLLDNTHLSIEESVQWVLEQWAKQTDLLKLQKV